MELQPLPLLARSLSFSSSEPYPSLSDGLPCAKSFPVLSFSSAEPCPFLSDGSPCAKNHFPYPSLLCLQPLSLQCSVLPFLAFHTQPGKLPPKRWQILVLQQLTAIAWVLVCGYLSWNSVMQCGYKYTMILSSSWNRSIFICHSFHCCLHIHVGPLLLLFDTFISIQGWRYWFCLGSTSLFLHGSKGCSGVPDLISIVPATVPSGTPTSITITRLQPSKRYGRTV